MQDSLTPTLSPNRTSFRRRVLSAGTWSLAGYGLSNIIRLAGNLVMARLLVPEAFGLMAIAIVLLGALTMFSDIGLNASIVQSKRGDDPTFLNTAWVAQIFRGMILFSLALGACLVLVSLQRRAIIPQHSVYADPSLPAMLAVMSVNFVIGGLLSTKLFEANRNLSFRRLTTMELAAQVVGLLCTLGWALIDRSVWALVAGAFGWTLTRTVMSHTHLTGVPNRWMWDRSAFQAILHFGKWIFLSSILGFLVAHGDRLLLAGLLGPNAFGLYVIAYLIFSSIEQAVTKFIQSVSFPALSEVARERPAHLKSNYYRFHAAIGSFTYFCAGALIISGNTLIGVLYDHRYEQAGWMLQILAAALLTIPFRVASVSVVAMGLPKLQTLTIAAQAVSLYILVPVGFHFFGLQGALAGIVASYFAVLPTTVIYKIRYKLLDYRLESLMLLAVLAGMAAGKGFNLVVGSFMIGH
jgi:O-antigen/teichoic acid export membrane protein